jgi:hypothetical protein
LISEQERRAAITAARFAARRGLPVTSCPWRQPADDRQRALRGIWVRTYLRARPQARGSVDYSG